jgi:hypothetical protein
MRAYLLAPHVEQVGVAETMVVSDSCPHHPQICGIIAAHP